MDGEYLVGKVVEVNCSYIWRVLKVGYLSDKGIKQ